MKFILKILISAIAVFAVSRFLPGVQVDDGITAVLVAVVLAFLNSIVKPILTILTIPITIVTLGLFLLVINAAMILLAGKIVDGFHVNGLFTAMLFSIILSIFTGILNMLLGVNRAEEE